LPSGATLTVSISFARAMVVSNAAASTSEQQIKRHRVRKIIWRLVGSEQAKRRIAPSTFSRATITALAIPRKQYAFLGDTGFASSL
jgi:hypothetical protein